MILILGKKYNFTPLEMQRLEKKGYRLQTIDYKDREPQEIIKEINSNLQSNNIKTIVLNTRTTVSEQIIKYLTNLQFEKSIKYISVEHFLEKELHKCYIPSTNNELHFLEDIKTYNFLEYGLKRAIDYLGVFVLYCTHLAIKPIVVKKQAKESSGNLYFTQKRTGKDAVDFNCYKFRSMHEDSYHDPYTKEGDSRVYPYGDFMRKVRIDEIPQYKNILKGEMHLIGPRAEWNILVENYEKQIPYYHERHLVAPGITGWAQVMYPYGANAEDAKQKLMYDLYYIKHWSILLELKVIWKTILVVLGKQGL